MARHFVCPLARYSLTGIILISLLATSTVKTTLVKAQSGTQSSQPATERLRPDIPVERTLNGGEHHRFTLSLQANDYLKLVVYQKGIDVIVRLLSVEERKLLEVDSPNGTQGPEALAFIADTAGTYYLEVASLEPKASPGKYEIKVELVRPATAQDRSELEVKSRLQKAQTLRQAGKLDDGLSLATQALETSEKILGTEHPLVSDSLQILGALYKSKGDAATAESNYRRALTLLEKRLGPEHSDVATTLNSLALVFYERGEYAKAGPLFERALAIREKISEPSSLRTSLTNLASNSYFQEKYAQAERLFIRAVAIGEQTLGSENLSVAANLFNLGLIYKETGAFAQAEPLFRRALAIREKQLGPENPRVAKDLNSLAELYQAQGDYTTAEPLFVRALAIHEKALGPEHPDVAVGLNNLALLYEDKGDSVRAEDLYLRGLAILEKSRKADPSWMASILSNLANLHQARGNYAQAEAEYRQVLAILEKSLGTEHPKVAICLNNLALLKTATREYEAAEKLYDRVLAIREKIFGPEHPKVAFTLFNLAGLYGKKGDLAKAKTLYQQALALQERALAPNHPELAQTLYNLAALCQADGTIAQAAGYLSRSNEVTERDLIRNLVLGSERQKLLYLDTTSLKTDLTVSFHLQAAPQNPEALQAAMAVVLRRKGRALDATANTIETLRRRATPEDQALLDELTRTRQFQSTLTLKGQSNQTQAAYLAELDALEKKAEDLEAKISARSAEFQVQHQPVSIENIQKAIPPDAILIEFVRYKSYDPKGRTFGASRYAAYTLDRSGALNWADLGEAGAVDNLASEFRKTVRRPASSKATGQTTSPTPPNFQILAQELFRRVIQPIRKGIGTKKQLLIAPDGELNLIPFAALMNETQKYLVETNTITYLTSGRDLLRLQVKIDSLSPPTVVADPDYGPGNGPVLAGKQLLPLVRLKGTAQEGLQIKTFFPNAQVETAKAATEHFLKTLHRPAILHIATRGDFLEDTALDAPATDENLTTDEGKRKGLP
ncbi:MAG TPA: CHAT domain-containing protein, partial [Acidobacteriota bacterium]|nr:CHAT domain-containing protein [Acidobacteriota bacterium]